MQLNGFVAYQNGARNIGRWAKWPSNIQMSLPDIISTLKFAFFLAVASNDGANLGALNVLIEVDIRAWGRDPFSTVGAVPRPLSSQLDDIEIVEEEEKADLEALARALRRLKLMHDVEPNPGPLSIIRSHHHGSLGLGLP
jgi:hypothetical protein